MKEKIILAPGCNGTELLRTIAKFGKNTIGYRVLGSLELSKLALMKSGLSMTGDYLTSREEPSVIFSFLKEISYFKSASYADAENLAKALHTLRNLVTADEDAEIKNTLLKGEFKEKNEAIYDVYHRYMTELTKAGKIDSIGVIRKALSEADPFDAEFIILQEYPLQPIDEALIKKLSGGNIQEINVTNLFAMAQGDRLPITYTEGYGTINEVEDIFDYIYKNKVALDECVIAFPGGPAYPQIFFDLSKHHNIPVTYGSGIPIVNSYPARLLSLLSAWDTLGNHGIDSIKKILFSEAFDINKYEEKLNLKDDISKADRNRICEMAGNLRLSFDKETNDDRLSNYKDTLEKELTAAQKSGNRKEIKSIEKTLETFNYVAILAKEFERGFAGFFDEYAVMRPAPALAIDKSARQVISDSLNAYTLYAAGEDINAIVPQILSKTVNSENSREGSIHLTGISGAMACMRKHLFVCGLSASEFPGSPTENYLLLDDDLMLFDTKNVPTSQNRVLQNKENLDNLLKLAEYINAEIRMSYSGYDLAEIKDKNPSSVLFNYYVKENPGKEMDDFKKAIRKAEFFDGDISNERLIGKEYAKGNRIEASYIEASLNSEGDFMNREWSPSALEIFFQCPRRFYLSRILGIPEDEIDDPLEVCSAADFGTMAHSMMENLADCKIEKADFMKACDDMFEKFLKGRPPINRMDADLKKKDFIDMMSEAYDQEISIGNDVLSAEEEYHFTHPTGIRLHGYPDRVEKDSDGNCIIADFKTKRKIEHIENDINTCLQVVIYAWLCEQAGIDIKRCDYRYLRKNQMISCVYDDAIKESLDEKMKAFKYALENNEFPSNECKESCKYCTYGDICKY